MRRVLVPLLAACAAACGSGGGDAVAARTIATGLHVPWGVALLPNGTALVAERTTGRILRVRRGHRTTVATRVPGVDTGAGEGGLLGLAVSPHYRSDRWVYAYFTSTRDNRRDRKGRLWEAELGQDRFDEVNMIRRGRNYGWPLVEGRGGTRGGRLVNPKVTWRTDEASPAGAAIAKGALYIGALQGHGVWRVPLHGTRTGRPRLRFKGRYGRVRTIVRALDGSLWLTTSNRDGRGSPRAGDDRIVRFTA